MKAKRNIFLWEQPSNETISHKSSWDERLTTQNSAGISFVWKGFHFIVANLFTMVKLTDEPQWTKKAKKPRTPRTLHHGWIFSPLPWDSIRLHIVDGTRWWLHKRKYQVVKVSRGDTSASGGASISRSASGSVSKGANARASRSASANIFVFD